MPSSSDSASKAVRKPFTIRTFPSDTGASADLWTGQKSDTPARLGHVGSARGAVKLAAALVAVASFTGPTVLQGRNGNQRDSTS